MGDLSNIILETHITYTLATSLLSSPFLFLSFLFLPTTLPSHHTTRTNAIRPQSTGHGLHQPHDATHGIWGREGMATWEALNETQIQID